MNDITSKIMSKNKSCDNEFDILNDPYIETPWSIIESYFKGQHLERLVRHQLESYNNFVGFQIIKTIEMFNPVHIVSDQDFDAVSKKHSLEVFVTFENFNIYRPQIHENNGAIKLMFPQEARLRNFTYASAMTIDINIKYVIRNGENLENIQTFYKTLPKIHIGKLPIMLKSNICILSQYKHVDNNHTGECKYDTGGYFIINGSEKTVLGQERAAENKVYCFNVSKNNTKFHWIAEIKSVPDFKCISPKQITMMVSAKNNGFGTPMYLQLPRVKQPIPLFIVFRALGVISDKEICEKILLDISDNKDMLDVLKASIMEANKHLTQEECIKYITSYVMYTPINMDKETGILKKHEFTMDILNNDLFPHCHNAIQKIYFLGYMANKLLRACFEIVKTDDRDSYVNKRIDLTGTLLNNLFRNYFNKLVKDMEKQVIREINNGSWKSKDDYENIINMTNIYKIIKSTTIENGLKRALATGDFGIKHTNSNKVGVAQVLNRLTYVSSLSHARRISTPTDKSGKLIPPRKLHNTSFGFLCPAECFDPETEILMWDGTSKRAKNIVIGDVLVDDHGKPTTVRTTCSGDKNMYDVIPDKPYFMKHRVTDNHILTLKIRGNKAIRISNINYTHIVKYLNREELKFQEQYFNSLEEAEEFVNSFSDDDTIDITIEEYLKLNKNIKDNLVLFKTKGIHIHWSKNEIEMEPDLGMWVEDKTQLLRKKSCMYSSFNLLEVGIGPYVGWQLHDKRGRFCLKDGLVVHNTPEGQSVGIVKNLSYMSHITIYSNSLPLYEYVAPYITALEDEVLSPSELFSKVKVFINGAWIGITDDAMNLYEMLKDKKYKGIINIYTSIIFDYVQKEIRVCNDGGRLTRPLLRVKDNNILLTYHVLEKLKSGDLNWNHLLTSSSIDNSIIEYIDPEEQSWSMIATKPKHIVQLNENERFNYTHCEIHPSAIFGILASCIPFPEHNQSPRNTYQCLDVNELVLMSNGSRKRIADVVVGDEVLSFHPETMIKSYTKVVNQYVRETEKIVYKITTLSGREIIATEDHKFMTTEGWCEVRNMVINDTHIGILPHQNSLENNNIEEKIILTENYVKEFLLKNGFTNKIIEKYILELKNINLLPLSNTNYNLPILSRIFGFLLADGSINIYERDNNKFTSCSFDFGREEDVMDFENDIFLCGFRKCKYNKSSRSFNNVIHTTYAVTHNGLLPVILLVLGISYGRKTETYRKEIPSWIMNGSKLIKSEFLSGFQGGDGCKIRWNKIDKGYNFICAETSQQINPKYVNSLNNFMYQCTILLKDLEIEVSDVKQVLFEENRIKVSYKISDKHNNLIKYFDNIGYRYSSTKNNHSFTIIEYLKYKQYLFEEHKKLIEKIRQLYNENKSNTSISNILNIKVNYVADAVRSYKNNRQISMRNLKEDTIEKWFHEISIINNMVYIPIKSIEKVDNPLISDITVESENHSFIAGNNFLSSNCAQGKQAMGVFATNYENRMDKTAYVLNYPARPLVDTRLMNMIDLNKIPSGCNVIVAIMTHTGYNQEDSLLFNKGSVDRGLFVTTIYHTEKDEDKQKINGDEEIRCKPDPTKTKGMKMGNYNKVNSKGVIPENTIVENRDIIISKVTPIKENRNDHTKVIKFEDQSKIYRTAEETYIDKNYIDRNGEGYNFAKIRLRTVRKPVIGDKFCALPTQQVLTDKGWIEIKDVNIEEHRLATLDTNGKLTYEFPSAKFEYDHDDKMYSIQNKQVQITCTLNHRLYVKKRYGKEYELIEAKDVMGKMMRFQKTMENVWPDQEFIDIDGEQYNMDAWLQLLGMFISDGCCDKRIERIAITALKERKRIFLEAIFKNLNIEYVYENSGNYRISGKKYDRLYKYLSDLSVGALNKFLPDYVWNLSKRQSIVLLEALLQGDGSSMEFKGETFDRYGTISIQLANDITRLALHCGWSGIVKNAGEPTGIARLGKRNLGSRAGQEVSVTQQHTYYRISIIRKQNEPWINKKINDSNEEKLIDYQGKVYCVEMPSSHTYYMRETTHSPCLIIGNSSRHGQKGTIGNIIPEADIPFTANGQKPDIIINPHAIPSRMTIGQLKETVLGKVLVELGLFGDGTSFGEFDVKDICKYLLEAGYELHGNELLYNGLTGEQHECSIFMGPVFYQRLKHMVNDKSHSRSIGPMVNLTRQPAEGRSRDGGLRFGEMEKDAMVSHGAARFTRGRMYDVSDKYSVYACKKCGLIASYNNDLHIHYCRTCDNRADFAYVEMPYACKLLFQELITMNIAPRVLTK